MIALALAGVAVPTGALACRTLGPPDPLPIYQSLPAGAPRDAVVLNVDFLFSGTQLATTDAIGAVTLALVQGVVRGEFEGDTVRVAFKLPCNSTFPGGGAGLIIGRVEKDDQGLPLFHIIRLGGESWEVVTSPHARRDLQSSPRVAEETPFRPLPLISAFEPVSRPANIPGDASDRPRSPTPAERAANFDRADLNGDGRLDRNEFAATPRARQPNAASRVFENSDFDGDGWVAKAEFIQPMRGEVIVHADGSTTVPGRSMPIEQRAINFDRADANRDGVLDRTEFAGTPRALAPNDPAAAWARSDFNGDGVIVREEFVAPMMGEVMR